MTLPSSFRTHRLRINLALVAASTLAPALHASPPPAAAVAVAAARAAAALPGTGPASRSSLTLRRDGGPAAFDVATVAPALAAGYSGMLTARIVLPGEPLDIPLDWGAARPPRTWFQWLPTHGSTALATPEQLLHDGEPLYAPQAAGTWTLAIAWDGGGRVLEDVRLLVRVPAARLRDGHLAGYRIGSYPAGGGRYAPPPGFIEVTRENLDLHVSHNFRLAQFLTRDQADVWPKFVLIDPLLLDKLELVITELRAEGIRADRMYVMSGYRTPQYNVQGLGQGRASLSRHQYGDAADVWIENDDRPGVMADLNGDGRVDERDARVMLRALERVEARYAELIGGAGVYRANAAHGPFLHIDVRGSRARW